MTDRSPEVVWGLTKRFNCFKTKWMGKHWSHSPFSVNGFHNASQADNTIGVTVDQKKTTNNFRRTFTMSLKHKAKNGIAKRHVVSQSNPAISVMSCGTGPNKVAKAIQAQKFISDQDKKAALRKLYRLNKSTRAQVKGAAKAQ